MNFECQGREQNGTVKKEEQNKGVKERTKLNWISILGIYKHMNKHI